MPEKNDIQKIDHKKVFKSFYKPPKKPTIMDIPSFNYLKVDGKGNPNTAEQFAEYTQLLYSLSYTIRFAIKKSMNIAYTVMPLEGLWWSQNMETFHSGEYDEWEWTLMILQPDFVTQEKVAAAKTEVIRKKKLDKVNLLRFEPYAPGTVVSIMHIGPYNAETENIQWMHKHAREQGFSLHGLHQEIYLSDPRKAAPEKMKTILRQPIIKELS